MKKKSLNEAIIEEAGIPNLKTTFEDSRTHVDMPYGLGSAYIESEKKRKEIEDRFKEKDKEMEEYKKMYASEESKTRIKPEVNKKMYLSESLFEDSNLKFVSNRYSPDDPGFDEYDIEDSYDEAMFEGTWNKLPREVKSRMDDGWTRGIHDDMSSKKFFKGYIQALVDTGIITEEERINLDKEQEVEGNYLRESLEQDKQFDLNSEVYNALSDNDILEAIKMYTNIHNMADPGVFAEYVIEGQGFGSDGIKAIDIAKIAYDSGKYDVYKVERGWWGTPDYLIMVKGHDPHELDSGYIDDAEVPPEDMYTVDDMGISPFNRDEKNESLTEAKIKIEDDEDFNDYDMFTFIYNLFTRDMAGNKRPLNPLGRSHTHFDYTSKEDDEYDSGFAPISSTEDSIILYSNDKSDFDDVKEICDKYDFTYREGTKRNENNKYDFNIEIDVPTDYKTGMPMSIEEYFTDLGMEVKDVMPSWYVGRLAASKKEKQ